MKLGLLFVLAISQAQIAYAEDTLTQVRDSGVITLGVRESSGALSYFLGAAGGYVGYQIDICKRIAAKIQQQLGLAKLEVRYQPVSAQNRLPLIANKTIDLECGSTANTLARQRDVAFSFTTFVEETRIAVRRSSGIGSIDQIAGKKIVTTSGTTSVQTLRKYVQKKGTPFDETFGKDHSDSFLILEGGRADAFVMDGQVLAGMIAHSKSPGDYQIVGDALAVEPIAIAFRKDDPSLKKVVNDTIAGLMKSGEIKTIYEKWFQRPIPPGNANLNLPPSQATLFAWSAPNDRSVEDLQKQ